MRERSAISWTSLPRSPAILVGTRVLARPRRQVQRRDALAAQILSFADPRACAFAEIVGGALKEDRTKLESCSPPAVEEHGFDGHALMPQRALPRVGEQV